MTTSDEPLTLAVYTVNGKNPHNESPDVFWHWREGTHLCAGSEMPWTWTEIERYYNLDTLRVLGYVGIGTSLDTP